MFLIFLASNYEHKMFQIEQNMFANKNCSKQDQMNLDLWPREMAIWSHNTTQYHKRPQKTIQSHAKPHKAMQSHIRPYRAIQGQNTAIRYHNVPQKMKDFYEIQFHLKSYRNIFISHLTFRAFLVAYIFCSIRNNFCSCFLHANKNNNNNKASFRTCERCSRTKFVQNGIK